MADLYKGFTPNKTSREPESSSLYDGFISNNNAVNKKTVYDTESETSYNFSGDKSSDNIGYYLEKARGNTEDDDVWQNIKNVFESSLRDMGAKLTGSRAGRKKEEASGARMSMASGFLPLLSPLLGLDKKEFDVATKFGASIESKFYEGLTKKQDAEIEKIPLPPEIAEGDIVHNFSWKKLAYGMASTSTSMFASIGVGLLGGPAGPVVAGATFGEMEAQGLIDELENLNVPLKDQALLRDIVSPAVGAIELMNIDFILGEGADVVAKKFATKAITKGLVSIGAIAGANVAEEVAQKAVSDTAWNQIVTKAGYGKAKKFSDGLSDTVIYSALMGIGTGTGKAGVNAIAQRFSKSTVDTDRARADLENSGIEPELIDQAIDEMDAAREINAEKIAEGFDDMLDRVENGSTPLEQLNRKTENRSFDEQLEINRELTVDKTINDKAKESFEATTKSISKWFDEKAEVMSARVKRVSPKLHAKWRKAEFKVKDFVKNANMGVEAFIKAKRSLSKQDKADLSYALNSNNIEEVLNIADKNGMKSETENMLKVIKDIGNKRLEAGVDKNLRDNYFPRRVIDIDKFSEYIGGKDSDTIREALNLAERKKGSNLTQFEESSVIEKMLRGIPVEGVRIKQPASAKKRQIENFTAELMPFYDEPGHALLEYINDSADAIMQRNMLGKTEDSLQDSITTYVAEQVKEGSINREDVSDLQNMLQARFSPKPTRRGIKAIMNTGYASALSDIGPSISNFKDFATTVFRYKGSAFAGAMQSISNSDLKVAMEDAGVTEIGEEFRKGTFSSDIAKKWLALFQSFDKFAKEINLTSAMDYMQKNIDSDKRLIELTDYMFDDEAPQVREDIKNRNITKDVSAVLFSELSDIQPVSKFETTERYARGGDVTLLYQAKTFMLRQASYFREVGPNKIIKGTKLKDKNMVKSGLKDMVSYWTLLTVFGATMDSLRDLIEGQDIDLMENMIDNVLMPLMISGYDVKTLRRQGIKGVVANKLNFITDAFWLPISDFLGTAEAAFGPKKMQPKKTQSIKLIPYFGRSLYKRLNK